MAMPLVSVIMPVFNRAWCVGDAIESVMALESAPTTGAVLATATALAVESAPVIACASLELVIVDDGSDDATPQILARYAAQHPERIRVLTHPERAHRGIAASRNLGVTLARGKYLAFLDSDDIYLPDRFRDAIPWLESHPEFQACVEFYLIEEVGQGKPATEVRHLTQVSSANSGWLRAMLFANTYWNMPVITLRREGLERFGGFDESLRFAEETSLWLKLAAAGAVGVAQDRHPVARVRLHGEHSWDPSDRMADRHTFLHVLLDALDWAERRRDIAEPAQEIIRDKLRAYLAEILADAALPLPFRLRAWLRGALACPRLLLDHHITANLAYAPLRRRPPDAK